MNQQRFDQFVTLYAEKLTQLRNDRPKEYVWPVADLPAVIGRMTEAIRKGSFNKDGLAFQATCKALGIPHTYKAINAFLERE